MLDLSSLQEAQSPPSSRLRRDKSGINWATTTAKHPIWYLKTYFFRALSIIRLNINHQAIMSDQEIMEIEFASFFQDDFFFSFQLGGDMSEDCRFDFAFRHKA